MTLALVGVSAVVGSGGCSSDPAASDVVSRRSDSSRASTTDVGGAGTGTSAGRGTAPSDPPASSTVGTPAPTFTPDQQAVADAYQAAVDALNHAAAEPVDVDDPALSATMVDPMLTAAKADIATLVRGGDAGRPGPNQRFRIAVEDVSIHGSSADVHTCTVDDWVVYDVATAEVVNDAVSTARHEATLVRVDGAWMLQSRTRLAIVNEEVACELVR